MLKALALGASAVLLGRPVLYGLAVAGELGVRRVLSLLRAELELAMALAGCASLRDVGPALIWQAPPPRPLPPAALPAASSGPQLEAPGLPPAHISELAFGGEDGAAVPQPQQQQAPPVLPPAHISQLAYGGGADDGDVAPSSGVRSRL